MNTKQARNMKVVHLDPDNQRTVRARIARLPAAVHSVHEKSRFLLLEKLKAFFDHADDALFNLADKAGSNYEQNIYFDSMRVVRIQRRGIERHFETAIDNAFACFGSAEPVETGDVYDGVLGENALSLMHNDELEEMVAVESSVARAETEYAEPLQQIALRLNSLVAVKVYKDNNPLRPGVFAEAFMNQAKKLDVDLKAKLVLFKLFDRAVMQNLETIYQAVNQILIENRVLPTLAAGQAYKNPQSADSSYSSGSTIVDPANTASAAQCAPSSVGVPPVAPAGESADAALIAEIVRLLSMAQQAPVPAGDGNGGLSALSLIKQLQARTGETGDIGRTEQEVIKLVDMLFNFILEDSNLAIEMKEQISRLQIPIVKVALIDQSFFAKGGHAARRLLNEIATAGLGWQPLASDLSRDPLYRKVNEVVSAVLSDFETDVNIFSELLADFSSFVEKDQRRAEILERRTLDAEDGKAKAEIARTTVALEVEIRTINETLPEVVQQLIEGPWSNVLFVYNLKNGSDSDIWAQSLQTLEDLIWSTHIPETDEDRKKLIRMVPDLLQRLRTGLDSISFNPFEMSDFFKKLEDVHLSSIRGVSKSASSADPALKEISSAQNELPEENDLSDDMVASATSVIQADDYDEHSDSFASLNLTDEFEAIDSAEAISFEEADTDELFANIDSALDDSIESDAEPSAIPGSIPSASKSSAVPSDDALLESRKTSGDLPEAKTSEERIVTSADGQQADARADCQGDAAPLTDDSPFMQQVDAFMRGAWFQMEIEKGEPSRCRLAALIKPTGKYIFVNRNGMKVAEKTKLELAEMLRNEALRVLDNSMLFDRALETVVTSLRKNTEPRNS